MIWRSRQARGGVIAAVFGNQVSTELIEQHLRLSQIKRFEALTKPIIHARQQFTGFGAFASIAPKPRQARGCPKLPGLCLLLESRRDSGNLRFFASPTFLKALHDNEE
jgi:hypothetical protein